jgi:DNA modification methylase
VTGTATVIQADARHLPLADGSVDLIVTSPPYFALRDYKDGDKSVEGQIGAEATPAEFLEALWACSQEWWRVLAPGGSLWVNLGDKYATGATPNPQSSKSTMTGGQHKGVKSVPVRKVYDNLRTKSLLGLPWRYAIGMTDGQGDPGGVGWILRAEVIWAKPNGLPESVRDRVARKHEQWFHFTKSERYFSAVDLIREEYQTSRDNPGGGNTYRVMRKAGAKDTNLGGAGYHPLGKLPGSVWTVATEPLKVPDTFTDHFAAFPSEWPRRIILGWAPKGGTVLDPFGGTGTTAAVAKALGCRGISVDLSAAYCQLAQWRTNGDGYTKIAKKVADRTPAVAQPTLDEAA